MWHLVVLPARMLVKHSKLIKNSQQISSPGFFPRPTPMSHCAVQGKQRSNSKAQRSCPDSSSSFPRGRKCASRHAWLELTGNQAVFTEEVENHLSLALENDDIIFWHFKYSNVYIEKTLAIRFFSRLNKIGLFLPFMN